MFSSNYALYGQMADRVVQSIGSLVPDVEVYSIDESFLNLGGFPEREVEPLARALRERVYRWVAFRRAWASGPRRRWRR